MRSTTRRLLTCALLVLYGGITLLDQGLHLLVPTGAHHHGLGLIGRVTVEAHDVCHSAFCGVGHRSASEDATESEPNAALRSGGCAESSHLCPVCAYLVQARSGQLQLLTVGDWRPLVVRVVVATEHYQSQAVLGPYAPRGPPHCCA